MVHFKVGVRVSRDPFEDRSYNKTCIRYERIDMLCDKDIIEIIVPTSDQKKVIENAKKAEIGGVSRIRSAADRKNKLSEDQLVGQISTYAGSVYLTGNPDGYWKARDIANANPHKGDGGVDIIGLDNVDIKGSLMRYSKDPLEYRLLVRPKERHQGWIYVLAMVPKSRPYTAHLVGWAKDKDLPKEVYDGSISSLKGAYCINGRNLRAMNKLQGVV